MLPRDGDDGDGDDDDDNGDAYRFHSSKPDEQYNISGDKRNFDCR